MSLQTRLTLLYVLLALPALLIFGVVVYLVASRQVYGALDDNLRTRVSAIDAALVLPERTLSSADIAANRAALDRQALDGTSFAIRTGDGTVLYNSSSIQGTSVLNLDGLVDGIQTRGSGSGRQRLLARDIVRFGNTAGQIVASHSLVGADTSVATIRDVLFLGGAVVLLFTGAMAHFVAGRAVTPVRELAQLADELERTADFSSRLKESQSPTEMREMAQTFNRMVARVERVIQAQRRFISDSSHELRRPLTNLRTNIDVMYDPALSPEDRGSIQEEMKTEAELMTRLVSQLLTLSRHGENAFRSQILDLSDLAQRVVDSAEAATTKSIKNEIEPGILVYGDLVRIEQAVENLLQNASAYTDADGLIVLSVRTEEPWAVVEVRDNGLGMSEADLDSAFQRFYRGSAAEASGADGFGLGLAIVKHIVESHLGTVSIRSALGHGTCVTLRLPLS